jgi:hypothetical protein
MNPLPLGLGIWIMAGKYLTLSNIPKGFANHDHEFVDQICTKIVDTMGSIA